MLASFYTSNDRALSARHGRSVDGVDRCDTGGTDSELSTQPNDLIGVSGSLLVSRRFLASALKPSTGIIQHCYVERSETRAREDAP